MGIKTMASRLLADDHRHLHHDRGGLPYEDRHFERELFRRPGRDLEVVRFSRAEVLLGRYADRLVVRQLCTVL